VNVVQDLHRAKKEIDAKGGELDSRFTSLPSMVDLDMEINEEGDNLFDVLKNDDADMPDEAFHTKDILRTKLLGLLTCLDERERAIVEDYFGLSGSPRTLEDIGGDFNLTKERVRQIKEKSLRKLRNLSGDLFEWM
jgi:RNA polymerase primary sigma factor